MVCSKCNSPNEDNAKFCNNCGKGLLSQLPVKQEIVLGNDFFVKLRDIYYEKILKMFEQFNNAEDIQSAVRLLESSNIKKEYSFSVQKYFDYLISSSKKVLSEKDINYIKEKQDTFLSESSEHFFLLLNDLDEKATVLLQNDSKNFAFNFAKGFIKSFNDELKDTEDWIGGISKVANASLGDNEDDNDKIDNKTKSIFSDFNNAKVSVAKEYDAMWEKLSGLFDKIEENTHIRFKIDHVVLNISTIVKSNLGSEDSGFYFYGNIPAGKKATAKNSYLNMDEGEELIFLYDSTVFGSAKEGICLTEYKISWRNAGEDYTYYVGYGAIEETKIDKDGFLEINGKYWIHNSKLSKDLKKTIDEIVAYLKSRRR
jgi:hypothetical protein